ncbi:LuxR C-terminal-related transcriptional regulator [Protofrankia coriariae]|uniref:LuxR C-terminal-related transcriptional regulator n=1 Tax=Protofrankia coriariae TaxID=1562887 RepID=UPI00069A4B9F|nr:LuxR C-terminal-related transcriptional regulator [Protofrankia coriariae]
MPTKDIGCQGRNRRPTIDGRVHQRSISDQTLSEVLTIIGRAQELLRSQRLSDAAEIDDLPTASIALDAIWRGVRTAAAGDRAIADRLAGADDLLSLAIQLKNVYDDVREERAQYHSGMLRNAQNALSRLRQTASVPELIESAPSIVCTMGFDRAILSRIHHSLWMAEALHVEGDGQWAQVILQAGRDNPQKLVPNLFETEIVRRKRPLTVTNVQRESRVHRPIAEVSQCRSYVAVPIMSSDQMIGFLHADRYFHRGGFTDFDQDVLTFFAEGFGYTLERAILLERLTQMRTEMLRYAAGLTALINDDFEEQSGLGTHGKEHRPARPERPPDDDRRTTGSPLTRREIDVLRLMAAGDTNHQIASKLVITEGTVKSHVKHILRKLLAANRAEAVSIWLNGQR